MKTVLLLCVVLNGLLPLARLGALNLPRTPYAYLVSSHPTGQNYFRMIPSSGLPGNPTPPSGVAFSVEANGSDRILWRVDGWWAHRVFLSDDGEYLIRLGNMPTGDKPSDSDLAIAFYKSGQEIRSYSTRELIRDDSKVEPSIESHYSYLEHRSYVGFELNAATENFLLTTVDGLTYRFEYRTGRIRGVTSRESESVQER